ncbi:MAG: shikimate dehydrogenase [Phenylobacterium sp.]|uniref:shikimate dehydrogenase n=1 Tax=Phenylobacterium sp. TaxID=1871053 RepID=UPI0025FD8DF1|nr:shikimate dehydrogenase [Phenylobacterium sp.]MCA3726483.1 shikimate dehydrogenase [Phenylobacterium sp.]MCA3745604.1 shikimate dehydrogenase [Phenylobacterium sp.]MCA6271590.1 shikimate dehydrogenase [Phenylobacterium sp.]MCA6278205.1 shikimate dehydrogenase [Phenylobacterium sp.]MCA6283895.1 shikimate dehydrogenase [Phenylobacterium sp.]
MTLTAATRLAGVVGRPVHHSLSPVLHNTWLAAAGLDGAYVAFSLAPERFSAFVEGFRGGSLAGVNVTLPFKTDALAAADRVSPRARTAGAANVLVFEADGSVTADNTDGEGLLYAFARQAPGFRPESGPLVLFGAGGAARGAAAAFLEAGCPEVRLLNRTRSRAEAVAEALGGRVRVLDLTDAAALDGAAALINASSAGLGSDAPPPPDFSAAPAGAVAMDMTYKPLRTPFLEAAAARGLATVDGLDMLIGQARPAFEAFFGRPPPAEPDVRGRVLSILGEAT